MRARLMGTVINKGGEQMAHAVAGDGRLQLEVPELEVALAKPPLVTDALPKPGAQPNKFIQASSSAL